MKQSKWILTLAAGAVLVLALASPSLAAIDGSHHDMTTYLGPSADSKCFYCHGLPQTIPAGAYGQIGDFCVVRCHQLGSVLGNAGEFNPQGPSTYAETAAGGTITVSGGITGPLTLAYDSGSHPVGTSTTEGPAGQGPSITAPDTIAGMINTTWPYTSNAHLSQAGNAIQCTSCHSVHDNDSGTPFLWVSMGTQVAPVATSAATAFCSKCHNGRHDVSPTGAAADVDTIAALGSHPVEVTWNATTAQNRVPATSGRRGRWISMDDPDSTNVFDVPFSSTGSADFDPDTNKYQTGGHVGNMVTSLADGDAIGCYTCHSAHATGTNALLIANKDGIDTSPLCIGCHGPGPSAYTGTTSDSNPGVSPYYHPCNIEAPSTGSPATNLYSYTASNGVLPIVAYIPPANQGGELVPLGLGSNQLLCTSCHDVHDAYAGDMSIQDFGQGAALNGYVCAVCHTGEEGNHVDLAAADSHHITYTTKPTYFDTTQPSWSTAGGGAWPISIQDRLDCADCHVFNGTAHNW